MVVSSVALAAQTLEVRDGDTAIARISLRDQTRIRVDRARITDVLGDIYDAQRNPSGRIVLVKDDQDGEDDRELTQGIGEVGVQKQAAERTVHALGGDDQEPDKNAANQGREAEGGHGAVSCDGRRKATEKAASLANTRPTAP